MTARSPEPPSQTRSIISFFSGRLGTIVIGLVASLLMTRWTAPHQMGLWNFAVLIVTYASALQLGVFNGLNRQVPYYAGLGDAQRSARMAEVAYGWCRFLSLVSAAALIAAVLYLWQQSRWELLYTTIAAGVVLLCSWSLQYLTVCYTVNSEFSRLARNSLLVALLGLPMIFLVQAFGYPGLLIRAAAMALLGSLTLYVGRSLRVQPRWDRAIFKELTRVGFPIWLLGQVSALFMTLDRVVIAHSPQALGYYTVAVQFGAMSAMVPTAFNAVLYPRMARQYGETHNARELWAIALRASLSASAVSAAAGFIAWLSIPYFVEWLLPAYVPGTAPAQWASLTGLAMGFSICGNIFNVLGRQHVYLIAAGGGLVAFFGTWLLLTRVLERSELSSAAQSMLVATLITSFLSAALSRLTCIRHDRARLVASSIPSAHSRT